MCELSGRWEALFPPCCKPGGRDQSCSRGESSPSRRPREGPTQLIPPVPTHYLPGPPHRPQLGVRLSHSPASDPELAPCLSASVLSSIKWGRGDGKNSKCSKNKVRVHPHFTGEKTEACTGALWELSVLPAQYFHQTKMVLKNRVCSLKTNPKPRPEGGG